MTDSEPFDVNPSYRPSVQDLLVQTGFEKSTGGSTRGWSALGLYCRCPRAAFHQLIEGLQSQRPSDAIDLGILYHACMEAHYTSGGANTFKPIDAVETAVPEIASECRRLVTAKLARFGKEEAETWDVRAVEYEVVAHVEGKPTVGAYKGKKIKAPVSSKFDLILAKRERGAPCAPWGPVADGVIGFDHKTTSRLSKDKVEGFGMDPQLLLMSYNWKNGGLDKVFGKLNSFMLEIVVATKVPAIERIEVTVEDRDVERFIEWMAPHFLNLESLFALPPEQRGDLRHWPMNYAGCRSAFGLCKYFTLCESHGQFRALYSVPPGFTPARGLMEQTPGKTRAKKAKDAELEEMRARGKAALKNASAIMERMIGPPDPNSVLDGTMPDITVEVAGQRALENLHFVAPVSGLNPAPAVPGLPPLNLVTAPWPTGDGGERSL